MYDLFWPQDSRLPKESSWERAAVAGIENKNMVAMAGKLSTMRKKKNLVTRFKVNCVEHGVIAL